MSPMSDAIRVLGEERVAEIRACAGELLREVLANRQRYARRVGAVAGSPAVRAA